MTSEILFQWEIWEASNCSCFFSLIQPHNFYHTSSHLFSKRYAYTLCFPSTPLVGGMIVLTRPQASLAKLCVKAAVCLIHVLWVARALAQEEFIECMWINEATISTREKNLNCIWGFLKNQPQVSNIFPFFEKKLFLHFRIIIASANFKMRLCFMIPYYDSCVYIDTYAEKVRSRKAKQVKNKLMTSVSSMPAMLMSVLYFMTTFQK